MTNSYKHQLHRDFRYSMSFAHLMFSRSGVISYAAQTTVGVATRLLLLVGATATGQKVRGRRLEAASRYRSQCDKLLADAVRSGFFDTYVDVGAHTGEQVLEVGQHLSVIAFEPDPRVFESLARRVAESRNSLKDDVRLYQKAVSNTTDRTALSFLDSSPDKTGGSTIVTTKRGFSHQQSVMVDTIDIIDVLDLVKDTRRAIIKIDVEGAEYRIIRRLANKRKLGNLGLVLVEFHEKKMRLGLLHGCWLTVFCWIHGFRRSRILEWY